MKQEIVMHGLFKKIETSLVLHLSNCFFQPTTTLTFNFNLKMKHITCCDLLQVSEHCFHFILFLIKHQADYTTFT